MKHAIKSAVLGLSLILANGSVAYARSAAMDHSRDFLSANMLIFMFRSISGADWKLGFSDQPFGIVLVDHSR
ncbi:hypothetical protein [Sphingorhabdus sp.]|jgi:hypothetical protein|uniref:hypothetical protein n=1 Tax=Sphingorhabdus sp. TaxID=1902408 RepID=UPI004053A043